MVLPSAQGLSFSDNDVAVCGAAEHLGLLRRQDPTDYLASNHGIGMAQENQILVPHCFGYNGALQEAHSRRNCLNNNEKS